MFYTTFSLTSPSGLIQGHRLSLYSICNMSQQSTWGTGHANTWDTHTHGHTQIPPPPALRVLLDRITPCGAAPIPPGPPPLSPSLFLSPCTIPLQHGHVTANQAFLSLHCGARVCKAIALPHPWSGHGEAESDGGCHLTASNST